MAFGLQSVKMRVDRLAKTMVAMMVQHSEMPTVTMKAQTMESRMEEHSD